MYTQYYGLKAQPFRLTPDPHYFFTSATHKSALAYIRYGMNLGEGFIVVTGAAGTGKTTLALTLLGGLPRHEMVVGELVTTQLQPEDLLRAITASFELDIGGTKSGLIVRIRGFLSKCRAAGKHVLLVVDEAHDLPQSSFEELRMLSNFHEGPKALLQCILLGQPPLRDMLNRTNMEQFQQRIVAAHHLQPLSLPETRGYILHRLQQAGWRGDPSFTSEAIKLAHQYTKGIPRRINALCNRLMLYGFLEEKHQLDASATIQVYSEWMQELGQLAAVETMRQSRPEEIGITGLVQEHATLGRAVGAGALPFHAAPAVQAKPTVATRSITAKTKPPVARAIPAKTQHTATNSSPSSGVPPGMSTRKQRETPSEPTLSELISQGSYTSKSESNPRSAHHLRPRAKIPWLLFPLVVLVGVIIIVAYLPADDLDSRAGGDDPAAQSHKQAAPSPSGPHPLAPPMPEVAAPAPAQSSQPEDSPIQPEDTTPAPDTNDTSSLTSTPTKKIVETIHVPPARQTPLVDLAGSGFTAKEPLLHVKFPSEPAATDTPDKSGLHNRTKPRQAASVQQTIPDASVSTAFAEQKQRLIAKHKRERHAREKRTAPVKAMPVSGEELNTLLSRFRNAYDSGNVNELAKLFASDARSDDDASRDAIVRSYQKLFNLTYDRHLALNAVRWQSVGDSMQGKGRFGVIVKETGRNWKSSYNGIIHLRVEKRDGQALITELNYSYVK